MYLRHARFSDVLQEIKRNSDLARVLGFQEIGPNQFKIPRAWVVSRVYKKLKESEQLKKLERALKKSVDLVCAEEPEVGKNAALDASDVRTHARPGRKDREGKERPSSDPEASWSVKTKRWEDSEGKKREEKESTFGYKLYVFLGNRIGRLRVTLQ